MIPINATGSCCRTVLLTRDGSLLVEGDYLGYVTIRDAASGNQLRGFQAQTTLIETIKLTMDEDKLLVVGAGFEGSNDFGTVKVFDFKTGRLLQSLRGHLDDIIDVVHLGQSDMGDLVASVGLDHKALVHDLESGRLIWEFDDHRDYLNVCARRPGYPSQFVVGGDFHSTFILDARDRSVVKEIHNPSDTNGLEWSADGRYLVIGDDSGSLKILDSHDDFATAAEVRLNAPLKRFVRDAGTYGTFYLSTYTGEIHRVAIDERLRITQNRYLYDVKHLWGNCVSVSGDRVAVSSFISRALLFDKGSKAPVGKLSRPSFGINAIALDPGHAPENLYSSHDDGYIRVTDARTGAFLRRIGGTTRSLLMGLSPHPTLPLLAVIDFSGRIFLHDRDTGETLSETFIEEMGPGICVAFSPCGTWLAAGGYYHKTHIFRLTGDRTLDGGQAVCFEDPRKGRMGVVKGIKWDHRGRLYSAIGNGNVLRFAEKGGVWSLDRCFTAARDMKLCNSVSVSPDGSKFLVGSRDQSVRVFDAETGAELECDFLHTRSVKKVHWDHDGKFICSGSYDRSVIVRSAGDFQALALPLRFSNLGISGLASDSGRLFAASFDGTLICWDVASGKSIWWRYYAENTDG